MLYLLFQSAESMWYLFQTITTIGFGDVIARSGYCENEDYEGQDLEHISHCGTPKPASVRTNLRPPLGRYSTGQDPMKRGKL